MIYLEDGFESGDFGAWTFTNNVQITSIVARVRTGIYAAESDGSSNAYVGTNVTANKAYVYVQFWFRIYNDDELDPTQYDKLCETYNTLSLPLLRVDIYKDAGGNKVLKITIRDTNAHTTTIYDTTTLNNDTWYCLEYLCYVGTGGTDKVWLDCNEVASVICSYSPSYTMENTFIYAAGDLTDNAFRSIDDVTIADTYINDCYTPIYYGGPYIILDDDNIKSKTEAPYCIMPFNMPYDRMCNNLELVCKAAFDADYLPWEWWIDKFTGEIHFDERKGSDKSATIQFVAVNVGNPNEVHIGGSSKSLDTRQSVQRVRVTGKSEGKRQDEITSNWQIDTVVMDVVGSFYEEVISEKMLSDRRTANDWARVHREMRKNPVEEIEIQVERDPYPTGAWEVGDDVTFYDPKSRITHQTYRIKRAIYRIDDGGEHLTFGISNAWQDVTDKLADIYQRIKQLQLTGFTVEDWTASGEKQADVAKMENLWMINRKYEGANEFDEPQSADPANSDSYLVTANFPDANGQDIECRTDELTIEGSDTAHSGLQRTAGITTRMRYTDWDESPRFHVRLILKGLDGEGGDLDDECMQGTGDYINFGIINSQSGNPASLILFQIECTNAAAQTYDVHVLANFNNSGLINRVVKQISAGEMHEYEARVHWDSKYVIYYIDNMPVAVIPIDDACYPIAEDDMELMYIIAVTTSSESCQPVMDFYTWKTQIEVVGEYEDEATV